MSQRRITIFVLTTLVFTSGYVLGARRGASEDDAATSAAGAPRVFEMRTYITHEGKLEALNSRFRNHTTKLFEKHGMTNVGYWVPDDAPLAQNTLVYIVAHPSREAAKKSWDGFRNDPEWVKVRTESEAGGKIVVKVDSVFMSATDYSSMK